MKDRIKKIYKGWLARKSEDTIVDIETNKNSFIWYAAQMKGTTKIFDMESGKKMIAKCIGIERMGRALHAVHCVKWTFIGYENEKKFKDMTFDEYLKYT